MLHVQGTIRIELRSIEENPVKESKLLAIWGNNYSSEEEALSAGQHWRSVMQRALAGINVARTSVFGTPAWVA